MAVAGVIVVLSPGRAVARAPAAVSPHFLLARFWRKYSSFLKTLDGAVRRAVPCEFDGRRGSPNLGTDKIETGLLGESF